MMKPIAPAPAPTPYEKPALTRFGTFRELTRSGRRGAGDACFVLQPDGSLDDQDERCYE